MMARRIQQLGSAVIDLQRKLNHEIKEREIDENALSNRCEEFHSAEFLPLAHESVLFLASVIINPQTE